MEEKLKTVNLLQVTGRIVRKNYYEDNKRLFLVMGIYIPRAVQSGEGNNLNRDFPAFSLEGDDAERYNGILKDGDHISIIGHMDTRLVDRPVKGRLFRRDFELYPVADQIFVDAGRTDANAVYLCGEIIRVFRNAEDGKRFYIITVRVVLDDGTVTRAAFTYFDRRMELEPNIGDMISMNGVIQTFRQQPENGARARTITTVVARNVSLMRMAGSVPPTEAGKNRLQNDGEKADADTQAPRRRRSRRRNSNENNLPVSSYGDVGNERIDRLFETEGLSVKSVSGEGTANAPVHTEEASENAKDGVIPVEAAENKPAAPAAPANPAPASESAEEVKAVSPGPGEKQNEGQPEPVLSFASENDDDDETLI